MKKLSELIFLEVIKENSDIVNIMDIYSIALLLKIFE